MQKDRKYGNTAYFTLCLEAFKKRNTEVLKLLEKCFKYINVVDEKNIAGMSIRDLLEQGGTEEQKKLLEANYE